MISLSYLRRKVLEAWENGHEQSKTAEEDDEEVEDEEELKSDNDTENHSAAQSDDS